MHCLLCHEKIPRFRYWRTKSEFCCDEHAATHRRQTLERLVGGVSAAGGAAVDPQERLAALAESGKSKQADGLLDAEAAAEAASTKETPVAVGTEEAGREWAAEEEFEAAAGDGYADYESESEDQHEVVQQETEWVALEDELAAGQEESHELEAAEEEEVTTEDAGEDEAAERELVAQDELAVEDLVADDEDAAEEEEEANYFDGASIQHDEPFPVDISPAPVSVSDESELGASEPLEPAVLEESSANDLLELLARESASSSETELEPSPPENSALTEASTEAVATPVPGADAGSKDRDESPADTAGDQTPHEVSTLAETSEASEPEPSPQQPEVHDTTEATTDQPSQVPEPVGAVEAATDEAVEPVQKAAPQSAKSSGLRPLKAWNPGQARGARKGKGGRLSSGESLNRLAGQLVNRDSKLRELGPGSEARREYKSKLVCFLPVQGGNGSSTVSLHVAEAISHHLKKRVLLADFDFHSGTLAFRLGLKPEHTFVDVFKWEQPENEAWDKVVCPWQQLDVLVAPPSNASIRPQSMDRLPDILMSALRRYPYVIVDHPDAIYSSSRHVLAMSDLVYLVCTPEITSLHLARRKVQQIRSMGVPGERLRLIVNRTGSWGSLGLEDVGKIAGVPVSWALMNDYAALRDAVWNGGLVQQGSGLAKQLRELGWSIMGVDAQVAEESAVPDAVSSHS